MFDTGCVTAIDRRWGPEAEWQNALNQRFPPNARRLRDQPNPVTVYARVVWERDGEEWAPGTAIRWDRHHALVRIDDLRCRGIGSWLPPEDLRPRDSIGAADISDRWEQ
jgi:hypothetical protein